MKPILLGEAPGRSNRGGPLQGPTGDRLAGFAGWTRDELLDRFDVRNLLATWPGRRTRGGDRFPRDEALLAWANLYLPKGAPVIVLGRRLAAVIGLGEAEFFRWHNLGGRRLVVIPHPSGLTRLYNDRSVQRRAGRLLRSVVNSHGD